MDNSEVLLERAIRSLEEANISENLWAVGGGTVLSSVYGHRLSKDIDIFISEPQLLAAFPRGLIRLRKRRWIMKKRIRSFP